MSAYEHDRDIPMGPRQNALLEFIKAEVAAGRPFPSIKIVADHFRWPSSETKVRLGTLIWRGFVKSTVVYETNTFRGVLRRVGTKTYALTGAAE